MKKTLKPLEINRAKWLTGESLAENVVGSSYLRDAATGLQCCLGFVARKEGLTCDDIEGKSDFQHVCEEGTKKASSKLRRAGLVIDFKDSEDKYYDLDATLQTAIETNDKYPEKIAREDRESKITELLKELGYAVTFTGAYPNYSETK